MCGCALVLWYGYVIFFVAGIVVVVHLLTQWYQCNNLCSNIQILLKFYHIDPLHRIKVGNDLGIEPKRVFSGLCMVPITIRCKSLEFDRIFFFRFLIKCSLFFPKDMT